MLLRVDAKLVCRGRSAIGDTTRYNRIRWEDVSDSGGSQKLAVYFCDAGGIVVDYK